MRLLLKLAATALCIGWHLPAAAEPFEMLHVRANTGGSAGGHVALRVGDDVFHYQAGSDMLLYLHRDAWQDFVNRYAVLDNRSIDAATIALDAGDQQAIRRRLEQLHLTQLQHHARLQALELQASWLAARRGEDTDVSLDAAGLFAAAPGTDHGAGLRADIAEFHGAGFLESAIAGVEERLAGFEPDREVAGPQAGEYFQASSSAEELQEQLALRESLRIIRDARPLRQAVLRRPGIAALSDTERSSLETLQAKLRGNILRLLQSPRPDRGRAMLASLARYLSVGMSLDENRLVLVDVNPRDDVLYDERDIRRHRKLLKALDEQNAAIWRRVRNEAFANAAINEWQYAALEDAATKYTEIRDAAGKGTAIRVFEPNLSGRLRQGPIEVVPGEVADDAVETGRLVLAEYRRELYGVYGYDLLGHNCSTELKVALQLDVDGATFIPAVLASAAADAWVVTSTYTIPSWREWRVAELRDKHNDALVIARESNRLTAAAYDGSMVDDAFLFFADGTPVLRPLQGIGNVAWAAGHTALGLLTLPFDRARRAKAGLSGMFYSAPELIGFNIRKGRYDLAPPDAARRLLEAVH